jgi:hypothetical protein
MYVNSGNAIRIRVEIVMLQGKYDLGNPRPRSTSCDLLGIAGHDIAEILLKVALDTNNQSINRN